MNMTGNQSTAAAHADVSNTDFRDSEILVAYKIMDLKYISSWYISNGGTCGESEISRSSDLAFHFLKKCNFGVTVYSGPL